MTKMLTVLCLLLLPACAPMAETPGAAPPASTSPAPGPGSTQPAGERPPAPWSAPPLAAAEVHALHLTTWRAADNRASCALLVPTSLGAGEGATPRPATFAGGWGIAYDLSGLRSAFGVAGTGAAAAAAGTYDEWPHERVWRDGSRAGYGPEGGSGPNMLAYLRVDGQECLYNVWSRLGVEHLEQLLESLRFVDVQP